jgi:hypothetical protein
MSILINKDTKVITQGITGKTGQFHTEKCYRNTPTAKHCRGRNPKKAGESSLVFPFLHIRVEKRPRHRRDGVRDLRATGLVRLLRSGRPLMIWSWPSASSLKASLSAMLELRNAKEVLAA